MINQSSGINPLFARPAAHTADLGPLVSASKNGPAVRTGRNGPAANWILIFSPLQNGLLQVRHVELHDPVDAQEQKK